MPDRPRVPLRRAAVADGGERPDQGISCGGSVGRLPALCHAAKPHQPDCGHDGRQRYRPYPSRRSGNLAAGGHIEPSGSAEGAPCPPRIRMEEAVTEPPQSFIG